LDTDTNGLNIESARKINCTDEELHKIKTIYDSVPVVNQERINELFDIMEKCLFELDNRGILEEEIIHHRN
jgi:hypothetical protein